MSVTIAETPQAKEGGGAPSRRIGLRVPRFYGWLGLAALVIAAVSLTIPSTPSYDPWAWLVWGREIIHLNLHTTGGPTWKPLPVVFTTVFSPFGDAQPDLWLVVARAGAVIGVVMTGRIAWRIMRGLSVQSTAAGCALAAFLAGGSLAVSSGFVPDSALGYSEGLMTAFVMLAIDRHLDGDHRGAFLFGFGAALDRPEVWIFWGLYGVWLLRSDAGSRRLVPGLFAAVAVLWFGPELWGSGHLFRGVSRAQNVRANSAANTGCPFCTELIHHAWPHALNRIKLPAVLGTLVAAASLWPTRAASWRAGRSAVSIRPESMAGELSLPVRMRIALVGMTGLGFGWWVLISVMTQIGFSGNDRYLVLGTALVSIAGALTIAWATQTIARLIGTVLPRGRQVVAAGLALAVGVLLVAAPRISEVVPSPRKTHSALVYQARLRSGTSDAVRLAGGSAAVLRCGSVMTEAFQVPMLAWMLDVHTIRVEAPPQASGPVGPPPNTIVQLRAQRHAPLIPTFGDVHVWERAGVHYTVIARTPSVRILSTCPRVSAR